MMVSLSTHSFKRINTINVKNFFFDFQKKTFDLQTKKAAHKPIYDKILVKRWKQGEIDAFPPKKKAGIDIRPFGLVWIGKLPTLFAFFLRLFAYGFSNRIDQSFGIMLSEVVLDPCTWFIDFDDPSQVNGGTDDNSIYIRIGDGLG